MLGGWNGQCVGCGEERICGRDFLNLIDSTVCVATVKDFVETSMQRGLFKTVATPAAPPAPNTVNPKNVETERALDVFSMVQHRYRFGVSNSVLVDLLCCLLCILDLNAKRKNGNKKRQSARQRKMLF